MIDNAPRAATITAIHPCYVAVIGRDEYKKCLLRIEQKNKALKIEFFNNMPLLQSWTKRQLAKLADSFTEKQFRRNQIVYQQDEQPYMIYVVKSGEFEVLRRRIVPN